MNTDFLYIAAIIIFLTFSLGMFVYYFIEYLGGFKGVSESINDYREKHKAEEIEKIMSSNEDDELEVSSEKDGFFHDIAGLFRDLFDGSKEIINYKMSKYVPKLGQAFDKQKGERPFGFSPNQVIALRKQKKGFTGIYIIYNYTKNMYYVGQGQNVYVRCSNHFLAKGNRDIYADYKYHDEFYIRFVSLVESGFDNLDDLERYYINKYNAYRHGYNKTRGNR